MKYFTGQDMHLIEFDGNGSKYVLIINQGRLSFYLENIYLTQK